MTLYFQKFYLSLALASSKAISCYNVMQIIYAVEIENLNLA